MLENVLQRNCLHIYILVLKTLLRWFISFIYYTYFLNPFCIDRTRKPSLKTSSLDINVANSNFHSALRVSHNRLNNTTPHFCFKDLNKSTSKVHSRSVVCSESFCIVTLVSLANLIVAQ